MREPNIDIEFRHTKTGCGTRGLFNMTHSEVEKLKELLSLPGLDIKVIAVEYPYRTGVKMSKKCPNCEGKMEFIGERLSESGEYVGIYQCIKCDRVYDTDEIGEGWRCL